MREKFIEEVRKELVVSMKSKKEIIRDLQEVFASALEHGESEQQVIERLGSPKEFADNVHDQLGLNPAKVKRARAKLRGASILLFTLTAACTGLFLYGRHVPANIIGQADAMTHIPISGNGIDLSVILLLVGGTAFVLGTALTVIYVYKEKR